MSGLLPLLRQRMRRDWKQLLMWTVGTALLAYVSYTAVSQSYGELQDRQALLVTVMANPVILLFRGLPSGAEQGALMVFLIFPWLAHARRVHEHVPRRAPHAHGRGAGARRTGLGDARRSRRLPWWRP